MADKRSYTGRKVLVTGADGFIGSHLVEALVEAGAKVTALSLYNAFDTHGWLDSLDDDLRLNVRLERGDVRDAAFMMRIAQGQEVIFHLAALIAIPHSYVAAQSYVDVNISGTLNVFEAARACGAGLVIHTSTSEVYGTAEKTPIDENHPLRGQSPYAATKIGADMMAMAWARSFDFPVAVLRPFNTYGPRQSERAVISTAIRQALDPDCAVIRLGDLTPTRDFNYVGDTVEAFMRIGDVDGIEFGRPYNAGSGVETGVGQVVEMIRDITGANKPIEVGEERFRPKASEVRALVADASAFEALTGWRPAVNLEQGLERTVEWWRGRIQAGAVRPGADYLV